MSRPRTDPLEVLARAAAALRDAPDSSANEICRQIGGRRCDVLAAVKALRAVMPEERPASRRSRFPMTQAILTLLAFGVLVTAYGYITVVRPHRRFDQSESIRWTHDCLTKQGFKRNDRLQNITAATLTPATMFPRLLCCQIRRPRPPTRRVRAGTSGGGRSSERNAPASSKKISTRKSSKLASAGRSSDGAERSSFSLATSAISSTRPRRPSCRFCAASPSSTGRTLWCGTSPCLT